jgi:FkbM family methyltransferase
VRIQEILPEYFDGAPEMIDISPRQIELRRHLLTPENIHYRQMSVEGFTEHMLRPGGVLVSLVGPHTLSDNPPAALKPALRRLRPGTSALLLPAWPIDKLPYRRLLDPLADAGCQVVRVITLDESSIHGVHCALVVEPTTPPEASTAEQTILLRLANERTLGDLVKRGMRQQAAALRQEVRTKLAARDARVREVEEELAAARRRIAVLESSLARHPVRAATRLPVRLVRRWRARRRRADQPGPAPERVVSVPVPDHAHGRETITITAPRYLRVPRQLAKGGLRAHEPEAMACFLAAIEVAPAGAVLDIGANVGIYAALASAVSDREVVAFEPTPALAAVSRRVAADNALGYSVESLALGAEDGTATFYLSDRSDASNSLAPGFRESSQQISVPVERLDSYVARTGVVPAVVKIDTETTEPEVLKGAARTITEHRPWILCEVLGRRGSRLTETIAPFGYHWYRITDRVPYVEAGEIDGTSPSRMWLFAPEPPTDGFWAAVRTQLAAVAALEPAANPVLS